MAIDRSRPASRGRVGNGREAADQIGRPRIPNGNMC